MKNYFLKMSAIGIVAEFIVASFIMKKYLLQMLAFNQGATTICLYLALLAGAIATVLTARYLDRLDWKEIHWKAMIPAPLLIFLSGIIVGSLVNFISSTFLLETEGLFHYLNFYDYFYKPVYWFSLIGIPCCLILGSLYRVIIFLLVHIKQIKKA